MLRNRNLAIQYEDAERLISGHVLRRGELTCANTGQPAQRRRFFSCRAKARSMLRR